MPWIQNVSLDAVRKGHHINVGENAMLIQIVDPCTEFPTPKYSFKEVRQYEFLDVEATDKIGIEFAITPEQAALIVADLQYALNNHMDVVVHCHAGICRSGAVAEIGIMMGFQDTEKYRSPNLMVKHLMMKTLGWTYDSDEEPYFRHGKMSAHGIILIDDWEQ